jgi:ATP-dependent Clp protease ATP-binding subunit ClpC
MDRWRRCSSAPPPVTRRSLLALGSVAGCWATGLALAGVRPESPGWPSPGLPLSATSRRILALAEEEAAFFRHDQVRPEHLLLAVTSTPEAAASRLLRRQGADPMAVVRAVVADLQLGRAVGPRGRPLSAAARRVVEVAGLEARRLGAAHVGTRHLLLGLMAERGTLAGRVLGQMGIDPDHVRRG